MQSLQNVVPVIAAEFLQNGSVADSYFQNSVAKPSDSRFLSDPFVDHLTPHSVEFRHRRFFGHTATADDAGQQVTEL